MHANVLLAKKCALGSKVYIVDLPLHPVHSKPYIHGLVFFSSRFILAANHTDKN